LFTKKNKTKNKKQKTWNRMKRRQDVIAAAQRDYELAKCFLDETFAPIYVRETRTLEIAQMHHLDSISTWRFP
jgi:hypothetical protein